MLVFFFLCGGIFAQNGAVASFTLSDHHDHVHSITFPHSKKRIIIIADRDTAADAQAWGKQLSQAVGRQIDYVAIAAVGEVPEFIRGVVKGAMKSAPVPRLLDWDNTLSNSLGFQKHCLVLLVDKKGQILAKASGGFSTEKMSLLMPYLESVDLGR